MPSPVTPILDDFNRADAATIGANWTEFGGGGDWGILSNQLYSDDSFGFKYYNVATYGPACEVYETILALTTSNDVHNLFLRLTTPGGGTTDGYLLRVYVFASPDQAQIRRYDNGVQTTLGATVNPTVTAGDKFLLRAVGSTITGYQYTSGAWTELLSRTDSTYAGAGYVGMYNPADGDWRVDDFGGGNYGNPWYYYAQQ